MNSPQPSFIESTMHVFILTLMLVFVDIAKKNSPSVVFIDEVDSIGSNRMSQSMDRSFAYQTLHQLLVELDG